MPGVDASVRQRKALVGWLLYDFANSPFTTLVVTFVYAAFFTKVIAPDPVSGTASWSQAVTLTAVVVALLSPLVGAIADQGGYRKRLLLVTTVACVAGCIGMYFAEPGQVLYALAWFVVANIAFELGMVFYNAFLPELAPRNRIGRISGWGWALGYVGGLLALALALVGLVLPAQPWFGIGTEAGRHVRATTLLVAAWFALFSLPLFAWLPEPAHTRLHWAEAARAGYGQLVSSLRQMRCYPQIVRLLLARMLYNDGLVTIFAFGGIYAAGTFGFTTQDILIFGIVLNVAAGLGAFAFAYADDAWGGKPTVLLSVAGLTLATLLAVCAPNRGWFWAAGILVGIFSGPNQAASRSLFGRFVPPDQEAEFYGLFAFSGKATAFVGPLLLGSVTAATGSQRWGVAVILPLFALGGWLLWGLDEAAGVLVPQQPQPHRGPNARP